MQLLHSGAAAATLQPCRLVKRSLTRMWANAQRDGRPAEFRWLPLFNVAKFV